MLVGIHCEGHDHLIVKALLAKLLGLDEATIATDRVDMLMGWEQVLQTIPKALQRFYGKCCAIAVVGVDNDGNEDLVAKGLQEDRKRPRHWLHDRGSRVARCRHCQIESVVDATRPKLGWLPNRGGVDWPIVVCVPVEMIESWLLVIRAVVGASGGSLRAEDERRQGQKARLYGRPEATREDVESTALPLIRSLTSGLLGELRGRSKSFALFADQVDGIRPRLAALHG